MSVSHLLDNMPAVLRGGRWKYYRGPLGVGIYTVDHIDTEGNYGVYFFKRVPGSRKLGTSLSFVRVENKDTTRKSKSKAMDRAYALAYGRERRIEPEQKATFIVDSHGDAKATTNAFCVKERKKVFVPWEKWRQVERNGRAVIITSCPDCHTRIQRYGRLIDCPNCGKTRPAATTDYICVECRESL